MQWNVGSSDTFDSWWAIYKEQLDEAFGKESYVISSAGVDTKLGENTAKSYTYTLKIGNNTYGYLIYATMHRGMIYVMTFTFRSGDIIENYKTDIDIITKKALTYSSVLLLFLFILARGFCSIAERMFSFDTWVYICVVLSCS
jgi:hypothetical protein